MLRLISNQELDEQAALADMPQVLSEDVGSALASRIKKQWDINQSTKRDVEEEMLRCLRQRKGDYDPEVRQDIQTIGGSDVYLNVSATIARTAASWIEDLLLPAGDKAWGLDPTPLPELAPQITRSVEQAVQFETQRAQAQGRQMDPSAYKQWLLEDIKRAMQMQAEQRAEAMEERIEDQMAQSGFADALAAFIDEFVTFPAAFMRTNHRRKKQLAWGENGQPRVSTNLVEQDERISPFDVYPSPGQTTIEDGDLIIKEHFSRASIYAMRGRPGYNDEAIDAVLEQYSNGGLHEWTSVDGERFHLEDRDNLNFTDDNLIDGLRFYGSAQGLHLLQWGMSPNLVDDPLAEYEVDALLIGSHVIRAAINDDPLGRREIYKASYQNIPGSFWGLSPLQLCRSAAQMCNSLARSISNNAGLTGGPQVAVLKDYLPEGEEVTALHAMKIWQLDADVSTGGLKMPIEFYQPDIVVDELLAAYEYFESKAADAAGIPKYTWGDSKVSGAGETAQGLAMLMEGASKTVKAAVRHIDNGVIKPRVERQYHDNMLYLDDPTIKGDLKVLPRGSSVLVAKAATQARRNEALALTANPTDAQILGLEGRAALLREHFRDLDMPDVIPDEAAIAKLMESMQDQTDPRVEAAQVHAQARLQQQELENQEAERDRQLKMVLADKQLAAQFRNLVEQAKAKMSTEVLRNRGERVRMREHAHYDKEPGVQI